MDHSWAANRNNGLVYYLTETFSVNATVYLYFLWTNFLPFCYCPGREDGTSRSTGAYSSSRWSSADYIYCPENIIRLLFFGSDSDIIRKQRESYLHPLFDHDQIMQIRRLMLFLLKWAFYRHYDCCLWIIRDLFQMSRNCVIVKCCCFGRRWRRGSATT